MSARIEETGSAFDQLLVRAARRERATLGAEGRALEALGLPEEGVTGSIGAGAGAGAKLTAIALIATLIGAGIGAQLARGARPVVVVPPVLPREVRSVQPVDVAVAVAGPPAEIAAPVVAPLEARRVMKAPVPRLAAAPRAASCDLSAEATLVEGASRALDRHDTAQAERLLSVYDAQCRSAVLAEEASLLHVTLLLETGSPERARALARALLEKNPHGVLAPRLLGILDRPQNQ